MNESTIKNTAYIDGANLHHGIESLGWKLDYARFRVWLRDKYKVETAYVFIGLIPRYKDLYEYFQRCGYVLVFKEVIFDGEGKAKGNCDADLVLHAVRDVFENVDSKVVIVSSDGDYSGLVKFLIEKERLLSILSPHAKNLCSLLLKRTGAPIVYLGDKKRILVKP